MITTNKFDAGEGGRDVMCQTVLCTGGVLVYARVLSCVVTLLCNVVFCKSRCQILKCSVPRVR